MASPQSPRPGAAHRAESRSGRVLRRKREVDFQSGAGGQQGNTLRTALQLNVSGVRLQGTGHRNGGRTSGEIASHGAVSAEAAPRGGGGILSTNAGYQSRSSQGALGANRAEY